MLHELPTLGLLRFHWQTSGRTVSVRTHWRRSDRALQAAFWCLPEKWGLESFRKVREKRFKLCGVACCCVVRSRSHATQKKNNMPTMLHELPTLGLLRFHWQTNGRTVSVRTHWRRSDRTLEAAFWCLS